MCVTPAAEGIRGGDIRHRQREGVEEETHIHSESSSTRVVSLTTV
jgi:hypothetical protein